MPHAYMPGIRDTHPSTPVARAKAASIDNEIDSKRFAPVAGPQTPPIERSLVPADVTHPREVEVTVKLPDAEAPKTSAVAAAAVAQSQPTDDLGPAPLASSHGPKLPSIPVLATLWVITAAIPALVVWSVMRNPTRLEQRQSGRAAVHTIEPSKPAPAANKPVEPPLATPKPAAPSNEPVATASSVENRAGAPTADSASVTASTVPVVVETESQDRVSVLVKSKPKTAKVYKRGKEIGRTPLVIQIGRGEHRIFEVGVNLGATRRISIDGEKPEITVTLVSEPRPAPSATPAAPAE